MPFSVSPFKPRVPNPGSQTWSTLAGSAKQRHCSLCDNHVYDLSALTRREAEEIAHSNNGRLCAKVTTRSDGSVLTADRPQFLPAAGALISIALAAPASIAAQTAYVSGTVLMPEAQPQLRQAEVLFVQNGEEVLKTSADGTGQWQAELSPGIYDVIFRTGPMFGQRVKLVELHAGQQVFSPVQETFKFGHLGSLDQSNEVSVTVGELVSVITGMSFRYAVRHPLGYLGMWRRRVAHALSS